MSQVHDSQTNTSGLACEGTSLTQDDIPVIVKAVVNTLSTSFQSDIPSNSNKTQSIQSTATDSDGTQISQSATGRRSTCSSTTHGSASTPCAIQTCTVASMQITITALSQPWSQKKPSANSGCCSAGTTAGDIASNRDGNNNM